MDSNEKEKEVILKTTVESAKLYAENLLNKNVLFIFDLGKKQYRYIETAFKDYHFAHLTGVVIKDSLNNPTSAAKFFKKCLSHTLSIDDFELAKDNSTYLKSKIIKEMMKLPFVARMGGEYNESRPLLYTERLFGNMRGCMGFVLSDDLIPVYVPNTLLNIPTRDMLRTTYRLMATYIKNEGERQYNHMLYLIKGLNWREVVWPEEIEKMIDHENLHFR